MSLLVIVVPLAIFALLLLMWSLFRIVGEIKRSDPIRLKHCLGLFVSLSLLDLLLCGYILIAAGLGHSSRAAAVAPLQCLFSFILIVICPVAAVLLYRYHGFLRIKESGRESRELRLGRFSKGSIVTWATILAIACAITIVAAAMGGWPLLMYALRNDHGNMAHFLINAGVNINSQDRFGWTPIAYCAARGDRDRVKLLLDNGADVNLGAPLLRAVIKGDIELVELLLDNGADVNAERNYMTPLMTASTRGNRKLVELLLDRGAAIDQRGAHGTALVRAAENRATEVLKLLIRRGADLNAKTGSGQTALMRASSKGFLNIATILLEKGADVHVTNYRRATALTLATERGHTQIRNLLIEYGAKR